MKKVPSIRFKKYTEPWDEKPFGEIFVEYSDKDHEDLPPLMIVQGKGTIRRDQSERHIHYDPASLKSYKLVRRGDFIVHLRSFEGGLEKANSDGLISPAYHAFHGEDAVTSFYYPYLRSERFINILLRPHIYGIRDGKSIDIGGLETIAIPFPSQEEQEEIGSFLERLDSLINYHHDKYEKMSSILFSMRDKLFAKPNVPVPENRFTGFEGEWEIRRLGDIISPYADPVPTPHNGYERLGIRSHGKGTFCSYVDAGAELETAQMHRVAANKMIVNITFAWEHAVAVTDKNDAGKLVSHRFPQFSLSEELHPRFLHYLILDERFRHHLFLASPGGAGRNRVLKIDEMLEYQVRVPKYEEQEKIANFLDSLEELTRLYAMRVEKLKNIKAACLEGMFV